MATESDYLRRQQLEYIRLYWFYQGLTQECEFSDDAIRFLMKLLDGGLHVYVEPSPHGEKVHNQDVKAALSQYEKALWDSFDKDLTDKDVTLTIPVDRGKQGVDQVSISDLYVSKQNIESIYTKLGLDDYPWPLVPWPSKNQEWERVSVKKAPSVTEIPATNTSNASKNPHVNPQAYLPLRSLIQLVIWIPDQDGPQHLDKPIIESPFPRCNEDAMQILGYFNNPRGIPENIRSLSTQAEIESSDSETTNHQTPGSWDTRYYHLGDFLLWLHHELPYIDIPDELIKQVVGKLDEWGEDEDYKRKFVYLNDMDPTNIEISKQDKAKVPRTRTDRMNVAILDALEVLRTKLGKEPSASEIFDYLVKDKDETGTIVDMDDEKLVWLDTQGQEHDIGRKTLANRLSRLRKRNPS